MTSTDMRHSAGVRWMLLAAIAISLAAALWWAPGRSTSAGDDPRSPAAPAAQAEEHEGEGSDPEANLPYLFAVYMITWGGFFAYVFVMSRRQREMRRELEALRVAVAEKESGKTSSGPSG